MTITKWGSNEMRVYKLSLLTVFKTNACHKGERESCSPNSCLLNILYMLFVIYMVEFEFKELSRIQLGLFVWICLSNIRLQEFIYK